MKINNLFKNSRGRINFRLIVVLVLAVTMLVITVVYAGSPLDIAGYLGFSYGSTITEAPTGEKPESKLWWNDGSWWGSLYNTSAGEYHIYRLDLGTQDWVDTGVLLDEREESRADTFWDESSSKLFVATHFKQENPGSTNNPDNWARLLRFSYDTGTNTYSLDTGFPVTINSDKTETLVIDKDNTGRLWTTYVSRPPSSTDYQVYINYTVTAGTDEVWATPFTLPITETHVAQGDIASVITFTDDGGPKVGIMWNNNLNGEFYFASHPTNASPQTSWTLENINLAYPANDHISLAATSSGQVLAAVKTSATDASAPLIGVIGRDSDGTFSFHPISPVSSNDTRPRIVINDDTNEAIVFASSNAVGGRICYHKASITTPLTNMSFPIENCIDTFEIIEAPLADAAIIIGDSTIDQFNNATSSKNNINNTTGLVVLASDDENGMVYGHGILGITTTPTATSTETPTPTMTPTGTPSPSPSPTATTTPDPPGPNFEIYLPVVLSEN